MSGNGSLILQDGALVLLGRNKEEDIADSVGLRSQAPNDGATALCSSTALAFVESERFQAAVGVLVALSVLELAVETDTPEWAGLWTPVDRIIVLLFTVELTLRLLYRGPARCLEGSDRWWSLLDLAVVVFGIADVFATMLLGNRREEERGLVPKTLHSARVLRMLRVFRVFPRLAAFLSALIGMSSTFIWIFLILFLFIFASAIVCTHLWGHAELYAMHGLAGWEDFDPHSLDDAIAQFRDVPTSLFSLFQVTTQDNWKTVARSVITLTPSARVFFVVFIVFVSWTMISVITAVAANNMIEATSDKKEAERLQQAERQRNFIHFLRLCFEEGDVDGNGELDKEEFDTLISQPRIVDEMQQLGLSIGVEELGKTWQMLDVDGSGTLTIDAFVEGLAYLQEHLQVVHFFQLERSVKRTGVKLQRQIAGLEAEMELIRQQNVEMRQWLDEQATWSEERERLIEVWSTWARRYDPEGYRSSKSACLGVSGSNLTQ